MILANSSKQRTRTRGFRGIGRLAGLGYCDELVFTTSFPGEGIKTVVHYNAKLLRELLLSAGKDSVSVNDVIDQIVSAEELDEKTHRHYFEVKMIGVSGNNGLMDENLVHDYLIQHSPASVCKKFQMGECHSRKIENCWIRYSNILHLPKW